MRQIHANKELVVVIDNPACELIAHIDGLAISRARLWEGSILAHKRTMPKYPPLRRAEDSKMMEVLIQREVIAILDESDLYLYIFHGNNTWNLQHLKWSFKNSSQRWINAGFQEKFSNLAGTFPMQEYKAKLLGAVQQKDKVTSVSGALKLTELQLRTVAPGKFEPSRLNPCPCGSGKRYKYGCGSLGGSTNTGVNLSIA